MQYMKRFCIFAALAMVLVLSCKKEDSKQNDGSLSITSLEITSGESVQIPGAVTFTASVSDGTVNLSTLEVSAALEDGTVIASTSIRTPGKEADITDGSIEIPFAAGMKEGGNIGLSFKAINVNGDEARQSRMVTLRRPALPETLYMTIGNNAYPMKRDLQNPLVYKTNSKTGFESTATAMITSAEDPGANDFIWVGSETPGTARLGEMTDEGISLSFPSYLVENWAFDTESFVVTPVGRELAVSVNGKALAVSAGLLYASIQFEKGSSVKVEGVDNLEGAYNRDFFSYSASGLTFLRESGTYDVYYSPKYNYLWVAKMSAVAPECYWVLGHGFTCASEWHTDYAIGGWSETDITRMGYAVKVGDDAWQCSMFLNNEHEWATCEFEIYSNLSWEKTSGIELTTLTGDTKGLTIGKGKGITSTSGFQSGYYTITFSASTHTASIHRVSPWQDSGNSGITVKGVELDMDNAGYAFANIAFTKGETVSVTGIENLQGAYNRDFFSYEGGSLRFLRESGTWSVRYYPAYNYMWVFNDSLTYPDCLYILGNGKMSCPTWFNELGAPTDNFYLRSVPYCCVAPKISDGVFQASMFLSDDNDWKDVRIEFYSDLAWGKADEVKLANASITGNAASMFELSSVGTDACNLHSLGTFVAGYYCVTIRSSATGATLEVNKLD